MIELTGFTVRYRDFTLGPVDLRIEQGERVALVGPNGAGKSTTIRALSGRLPAYEGSVRVRSAEVRDAVPGLRDHVGVLPERLLGLGWLTVRARLDFLADMYEGWDRAYAEDLCRSLDVPMDSKVGTLSKGTKVKLALVEAEAFRPEILLLDEPTSGIDPVMRHTVLATVDECAPPGSGRTVVFSTHILEDLDRIAERVLLLREGRLLDDTSAAELLARSEGAPLSEAIMKRLLTHE